MDSISKPNDSRSRSDKQLPRRLNQQAIHNMAMAYLTRYAASSSKLTEILNRKITRGEHAGWYEPLDAATKSAMIAATLDAAIRSGLIDDVRYAAARTTTLSRRGTPERAIVQALKNQGLAPDAIRQALDANDDDDAKRAAEFARRKRLGPWRTAYRSEHRQKDIAKMTRTGFSIALAISIIDANT